MKAYSNCEDVREDFSALLDGELSPQEQDAVESHLSDCSQCLRDLDGLKRIDTLYSELPRVAAPQEFESDVHELLNPKRIVAWPKRARDLKILGSVLAMAAGLLVVFAWIVPDENRTQPFYTAKMMESDSQVASAPASAEMVGGRVATEQEMAEEGALGALGYLDADDAPKRQLTLSNNRPPGAAFPRENTVDKLSLERKSKTVLGESSLETFEGSSMAKALSPVVLEQEVLKKEIQDRIGDQARAESELAGAFKNAQDPVTSLAESFDTGTLADNETDSSAELQNVASLSESVQGFVSGEEELRRDVRMRAAAPADLSDALSVKGDLSILMQNFDLRDGVWYERGYANEPTIALARDSDRWRDILKQSPNLQPLVEVREQVIFRFDNLWYSLARAPEYALEQVSADE